MTTGYRGPVRDEPLAVELHNTLYGAGGRVVDGLANKSAVRSWLRALGGRLPEPARNANTPRTDLLRLRDAVREALRAALERRPVPEHALETINRAAAAAPHASVLVDGLEPSSSTAYPGSAPGDVLLAVIAESAVGLLGGPGREALRACGAPGCLLLFVKAHPRQEWCSPACGNRARQARHYARRTSR